MEQFPQTALALKLPHLAGKPLDAVFVLPRKLIHFLHCIVDLLYAGTHLVQAASIYRKKIPAVQLARADGEMGAWGWNGAAVRLLFLPVGKNRQDCSYSANSLLFHHPPAPRVPSSQFAVWQTGADCTFYYHFNGAILAVRPALTRLP